MTSIQPITDDEFRRFQRLIYDIAGISMCPAKKMMVASRLQRRLAHYGLSQFGGYYRLVTGESHPGELQTMVDLLTTNETYFFREPSHFIYFRDHILPQQTATPFRVWSAACSSGEEVYSLAMVLADTVNSRSWEVMGSDLSQRVLHRAQKGHYLMDRNEGINNSHLKKYCLKGVRSQAKTFLICQELKARVKFRQINLKEKLPNIGRFDVIFLRNVLIYFDQETKKEIVHRVTGHLKPGGYLFISHTESLHGIAPELKMVNPAIFCKQ
ncbi:MAG: protein-glutamate O-methyltransferase CheR [Gammaproteobacteria bacterium]|nr:protein-glutamate O-methyltransferase CheR [Gammaproteobacteria bacterium]MCP4278017.1 protein-glutamate O-methyltransferase CheR [Gammaproteobacteria bacterium]